jgi:hypothetical protein
VPKEREVRKETDLWGNEKEVIYENDRKVGEIRTEERGGVFGIGSEAVRVEYDNSGREAGYTKQEERGGFIGIGSEQVEVRYDSSHREVSHSKVEERGGFLGIGGHHVRVEYDNDGNEVSHTNTERRGDFLGMGGHRVRVTRYTTPPTSESRTSPFQGSSSSYSSSSIFLAFFFCAIVAIVLFAISYIHNSSTQVIDAKKIAAQDCFMGECFKQYIVSLRRENSGLVIAQTRIERYCTPGYTCDFNVHFDEHGFLVAGPSPKDFTYKIRCTIPGGYIESAMPGDAGGGQRIPEPEQDPPHATRSSKQLWTAVCSGMTRR